jgi:lipid-A-disaccharide synthase
MDGMTLALESESRARAEVPGPIRGAVRGELARAGGNALLLPLRAAGFLASSGRLRRGLARDLEARAEVEDVALPAALPARPLRLFVGAAEASGERHSVRLIAALRGELARLGAPAPEILAWGGARTAALGVELLGDPLARAAMGLDPLRSLPFYVRLLEDTGARLAAFRPDLCIPVDSPALHVPLCRVLARSGLATMHLVAPQYWAWAPWRVRAYRPAVARALTILPFEKAWLARHGVAAAHVGHPALDGLPSAPPPDDPARTTLVLLPGSRSSVIARNLPWMLARAAELLERHPGLEIVLPHEDTARGPELEAHLARTPLAGRVRLALGNLHAELGRARAALAVSGTIQIDLLHHRLPTAVLYRVDGGLQSLIARHLLTVPWFSVVNLVARAPVFLESCFHGEGPKAEFLAELERALFDPAWRAAKVRALDEAAGRLGPPGAVLRAAHHALELAARAPR